MSLAGVEAAGREEVKKCRVGGRNSDGQLGWKEMDEARIQKKIP